MNDYYEELVQNVQKGEMYSVKMKDDPVVYLAIPLIPGRLQNNNPLRFLLNVVAPEEQKGVYEFLVDDIEYLELRE